MIRNTKYPARISYCVFFIASLILSACAAPSQPGPFVAPLGVNAATTTPLAPLYTAPPQPTSLASTPRPLEVTAAPGNCVNILSYVEDVSIPDGTIVAPYDKVEKIWRVQNDGTCNWDSTYALRLVGGYELGVDPDQMLYPARAGTEAEIRLVFIAPAETGVYRSAWQAYDPDGNPFGDQIFIEINVQ